MAILENLETSIADNDGMPNNEKVIYEGLQIPHYQFVEKCCEQCSCNPVTDQMIESQTSFEE